jgi:sulfur-oxidizing protein SoxY
MKVRRRDVLRGGGAAAVALAAGAWRPRAAAAQQAAGWNQAAFSGKSLDEIVKALGGDKALPTKDVSWGSTPEIAENGAVVPIAITSAIPKTETIAIVIEKNPGPLAAEFNVPAGTDASIVTRVKMGQSSNVHAVVKADGKYYVATRDIKVTLGGCGG